MSPRYFPAISSHSLGRAWNNEFERKLRIGAAHGFRGIEVFYEDLEYLARALPAAYPASAPGMSFPGSSQWDEQQLSAASYISSLCRELHLEIVCLQPFMHYEGLLDLEVKAARLRKLDLWFQLARRLGTDLIQIPSNFLPESQCTGDRAMIVADLREVADLGAEQSPPVRFAYEALCWGTHIDQWDEAYEIVKLVDRVNFGTCLDMFNILGRVYGDPTAVDGKTVNADEAVRRNTEKLRRELDVRKVFYVEIVDAERMDMPLVQGHPWYVAGQKARMSWSRNARCFPFEEERGAYLPVLDVFKAVCDAGYEGYVSFELFSRTVNEPGSHVPEEHAKRGQVSWARLKEHMGWKDHGEATHDWENDKNDKNVTAGSAGRPFSLDGAADQVDAVRRACKRKSTYHDTKSKALVTGSLGSLGDSHSTSTQPQLAAFATL